MNELRFFLRRAAADSFERGARNAKIFGRNDESPHTALADFGDLRFPGEGNFVQASRAVHNEGTMRAEFRERGRDRVDYIRGENAQHLGFGTGGIRERAEKIEDRALHDLLARGHSVPRRGVGRGCEQKTNANFTYRAAGKRQIEAHAQGLQHIRGAAAGADGAGAMLGNARASRRGDDCRGRRNVKRARFVSARAASIDESRWVGLIGGKNRGSVFSHNAGEPN
jgi:hypothetical protein